MRQELEVQAWMRGTDLHTRTRLPAAERRAQILRGAERMLLEQGYLPLPLDQLGKSISISKALVYTYFTTQELLFNAILEERLQEMLDRRGATMSRRRRSLTEEALAEADIYFDHVVDVGPVLNFILRDPFMRRQASPECRRLRERLMRPLARRLRDDLKLGANEAVATLGMLATIPEEAGFLVYRGEFAKERGRELCHDLVSASLAGLKLAR